MPADDGSDDNNWWGAVLGDTGNSTQAPANDTSGAAPAGDGQDTSIYTGAQPTSTPNPVPDATITPYADGGGGGSGMSMEGLSKWASNNKELAAALATTLAGLVGGVGKGVGDRLNLERKYELDRQLVSDVAADKTARTRVNVNTGPLAFTPAANAPLLRTSGVPVYDPVTGKVNRPGLLNAAKGA